MAADDPHAFGYDDVRDRQPGEQGRRLVGTPSAECENGAVVADGDVSERAAADVPVDQGAQSRPVGISGPAGRPQSPKPRSGPSRPGWGGAAAPAPVPIAGRHPVGWEAPPLSVEGGSYGWWSRSSTPPARESAEPARRRPGRTRNGVDARRCLGGSHRDRRSPSASGGTQRRGGVNPDPTRIRAARRPLRPMNRWRPAIDRPATMTSRLGSAAGRGTRRSLRLPVPPRSLPPMAAPGPACHYPAALRWSQAVPP